MLLNERDLAVELQCASLQSLKRTVNYSLNLQRSIAVGLITIGASSFGRTRTWVKHGRHQKSYVLRRPNEEWDEDCIEEKVQRKKGWMFWRSFHGHTKGPGFFWEKDWGTISGPTYWERTIPVVAQYLCDLEALIGQENKLIFMQDNALGHAAKETIALIASLAIRRFEWPPYSPDLTPIETVWKYIKEFLQKKYGDLKFKSYDDLKAKVTEAWEAVVTPGLLKELIESMPARMQAVIDANGKFTKY
jgi:DDE superfamily endonuclease